MKRYLRFTLYIFLSVFVQSKAQFNTNIQVRNVSFEEDDDKIIIRYQLENCTEQTKLFVTLQAFDNNGNTLEMKTLHGDIGETDCGKNKHIYWFAKKDEAAIDGLISFTVNAMLLPNTKINGTLAKSLAFPGWGDYNIRRPNNYWIAGVAGYACVVSAIVLNRKAAENYNDYRNSMDIAESNDLYDKATMQKNVSNMLGVSGLGIWTIDLSGLLIRSYRLKHTSHQKFQERQTYPVISCSSKPSYINTKKPLQPPLLQIVGNSIKFTDTNANNRIDANEETFIEFAIENIGTGIAQNLKLQTQMLSTDITGLKFRETTTIENIPVGSIRKIVVPIHASGELTTGQAQFKIAVIEPNGFNSNPVNITIATQEFLTPRIIISDYKFIYNNGAIAQAGEPIKLRAIVQNTGQNMASDVVLQFRLPENVFPIDRHRFDIGTLKPNESRIIEFEFVSNREYKATSIDISADLDDSSHNYSEDKTLTAKVKGQSNEALVEIAPMLEGSDSINVASLTSDIDRDIPRIDTIYRNRFALIIGNEDYKKYQNEANVEFARNDAISFRNYAENILGIPYENITLLTDAIESQMIDEIERLALKAKAPTANIELVFYYAGHGFPDLQSNEAYIMPVDIRASKVKEAIRLQDLYNTLTQNNPQRVTVFLDACFSGGGRGQGMLSARSVRIKPKKDELTGNIVVFSASSAEQVALPYKTNYHGLFTYFLLKKLRETKGNISYKQLGDYVLQHVQFYSNDLHYLEQTPEIEAGSAARNNWQNWLINLNN